MEDRDTEHPGIWAFGDAPGRAQQGRVIMATEPTGAPHWETRGVIFPSKLAHNPSVNNLFTYSYPFDKWVLSSSCMPALCQTHAKHQHQGTQVVQFYLPFPCWSEDICREMHLKCFDSHKQLERAGKVFQAEALEVLVRITCYKHLITCANTRAKWLNSVTTPVCSANSTFMDTSLPLLIIPGHSKPVRVSKNEVLPGGGACSTYLKSKEITGVHYSVFDLTNWLMF